jgi:two-component system sensor histidine kinase/response regulator
VWTNLISNAIKYSQKKEKPRVEIGVQQENGKLVYFVKDNGAGFDMKNYNRLFKVFQRLHADKEFKGTGVGLALVKRIVDRHDGRIWAESNPGQGTNFYFTLNG